MDNLGTIVLAVGGLGTAAFGIVEALKWTPIGMMGFRQITRLLGAPALDALRVAYGPASIDLLEAQYRTGRSAGQLPKSIRQGVRVGLTPDTAGPLAERLGVVAADDLVAVAEALQQGAELTDAQRSILGRFELALDARIDSALALADDRYAGSMRVIASLVAIIIALAIGIYAGQSVLLALIVGIAAVPVAPMAKDLSSAIRAAGQALPGRK
jgi:hypothetical protein